MHHPKVKRPERVKLGTGTLFVSVVGANVCTFSYNSIHRRENTSCKAVERLLRTPYRVAARRVSLLHNPVQSEINCSNNYHIMSVEVGNAGPAEIEMTKDYAVVPTENVLEGRQSADLTWVNLNFNVNGKNILTNCWGKVTSICWV